jgi:hypothetical protein
MRSSHVTVPSFFETLVCEIAEQCKSSVCNPALVNIETVPVFVPHCIYKAAMARLQFLGTLKHGIAAPDVQLLRDFLRLISSRWIAAGIPDLLPILAA